MADRLAREEGLHIGHSSGANIFVALQIARELHRSGRGGCIVAIVADRGDRYFAPLRWERQYVW
jgi:cysteine synthase B